MKPLGLIIAMTWLIAAGCAGPTQPDNPTGNPTWVDDLVKQFQSAPVGNPSQSIWRYEYHGQVVYFVPAQCCDMASILYDANGKVICNPDGGITGRGDLRCVDFKSQRTQGKLIWKDSRTR